jgi:hypothetical protein
MHTSVCVALSRTSSPQAATIDSPTLVRPAFVTTSVKVRSSPCRLGAENSTSTATVGTAIP